MPIAFNKVSGRTLEPVTLNVTALTASTAYVVTLTTANGHTQQVTFTTDASGNASPTFTPQVPGPVTLTYQLTSPAALGSASNTFRGV